MKAYTNFSPQEIYLNQILDGIKPIAKNQKNIQILYQAKDINYNENNKQTEIGHWICTYYDGKINHIYDSLNNTYLKDLDLKYTYKLYGKDVVNQFHKVMQQPNAYDCGVFAIAFATSLCFGKKPENENYIKCEMRKHLYKLLIQKQLLEFPKY